MRRPQDLWQRKGNDMNRYIGRNASVATTAVAQGKIVRETAPQANPRPFGVILHGAVNDPCLPVA